METNEVKKPVEKHHIQESLCETRPPYRQGKKLTAVKVYTVASESQHLFIYGVPKINLRPELKTLCMRYGPIKTIHVVTDCETEIFTECYHVQYERIQSARIAKRLLDNRSFYGHLLHVCYAPEYETLEETRAKLNKRRLEVTRKISNAKETDFTNEYDNQELDIRLTESRNQGGIKRNFNQNYINEIEDPILVKRLCKRDAFKGNGDRNNLPGTSINQTFKEIDDSVIYGPTLEDFQSCEKQNPVKNETVFVPAPVVKTNMNVCAKRIVFKKKTFGL